MNPNDGLELLKKAPLAQLQTMARAVRSAKNPSPAVTFVRDSNPNYTNMCSIACSFCAFCRQKHHFHKTASEVMDLIAECLTPTVLLQGGVHGGVSIEYLVSLVKLTLERFPAVHPHYFSAAEIINAAQVSKISVEEALRRLFEAGQRTIPGGGAEILSARVHRSISPKKPSPEQWLRFHELAHAIGFRTTATMMFGHLENDEDIIEHLSSIRDLQRRSNGFFAFIPWSFKPGNSPLGSIVRSQAPPERYLRIIACSRIYLDNFDHISASWFSEGKETGALALHYGADDFGGTVSNESVHKAAGYTNESSVEEISDLIRRAGFVPAERNSFYQLIQPTRCHTRSAEGAAEL